MAVVDGDLTGDAVRMIKRNAKLYRPSDATLAEQHFQVLDWDRAKKSYLKEVLVDARARSGSKLTDTYFGRR